VSPRNPGSQPSDLMARVDAEVRDRIAEAVDFVCLEMMAQARQAGDLPAMAPDNAADRAEFDASVETFLTWLGDELPAALDERQRQSVEAAAGRDGGDRVSRLLTVQVALAKLLPDYWQRFERARAGYAAGAANPATASGRNRSGWLGRLLGG